MSAPIARPTKGCCGTCAWLAKAVNESSVHGPVFAVYDETEPHFRATPPDGFNFVPVGINSAKPGHLVCFRRAADIPAEIGQDPNRDVAAVIWKDRQCPRWSRYEPGLAPRDYLAEERARQFDANISAIANRLTWTGIGVAIVIGLLQLSLMTRDSLGYQLVERLVRWATALWK